MVRVHLQFAKFMEDPNQTNRKSLQRLTDLLHLAERTGLYLDVTGLACYRKKDVPGWYAALSERERWGAQAYNVHRADLQALLLDAASPFQVPHVDCRTNRVRCLSASAEP